MEKEPTEKVYGHPLCKDCAKLDIDPEDFEDVVIESLCRGRLISKKELDQEKISKKVKI